MIIEFSGEKSILSNFWVFKNPIKFNGLKFYSTECAYQYYKFFIHDQIYPNTLDLTGFENLSPSESKRKSHEINKTVKAIFDRKKDKLMYRLVYHKFLYNQELKQLLLLTGDSELIEGNRWNDTYWGVSLKTGEGENKLGKILMRVREELK